MSSSQQKIRPSVKINTNPVENEVNDARFECPICICWLNEPVLTSCGHRFCKNCIHSWLKNQNNCCPLDNKELSIAHDIFPDNYTRREIAQMKSPCPNATAGCHFQASPLEMDSHLLECQFQQRTRVFECPFTRINCKFTAKTEQELNTHVCSEMTSHLNLLMGAFNRTQILDNIDTKQWDAPNKNNATHINGSNGVVDENLIKAMYERIVVLEQKSREQESKIEKITKELSLTCRKADIQGRYSNGVIIWELTQFSKKVEFMTSNPNNRFYSVQAYTSPYGYKFCARLTIPQKIKDKAFPSLSLHVHMMQSENDFHLDWPFQGRIKISMIHPKDQSLSQHDIMMSNPEILAFHQPTEEISPRGFGYMDYASISNILSKGFVSNDTLTLKIQVNIV